jgi:hypothetical protein
MAKTLNRFLYMTCGLLITTQAHSADLCRVTRLRIYPDGTMERIVSCPAYTIRNKAQQQVKNLLDLERTIPRQLPNR